MEDRTADTTIDELARGVQQLAGALLAGWSEWDYWVECVSNGPSFVVKLWLKPRCAPDAPSQQFRGGSGETLHQAYTALLAGLLADVRSRIAALKEVSESLLQGQS